MIGCPVGETWVEGCAVGENVGVGVVSGNAVGENVGVGVVSGNGVLWESDRIIWVVDGIERFRITNNIPALSKCRLQNINSSFVASVNL